MMKRRLIYIALALMIVGFSVMTTTLFINSGARISSLEEDFDIYFSSAVLDGIDKTNMLVTEDKKHITFETKKLKEVGDYSILDFEVTNNSTQYDAHVEVSCVSDVSEYVTLETDKDTFDIVAQTRESGKLTIKLYKSADSFIDGTITCSLNTNAVERETRLEKILVDPKYQITGTLQDDNGIPLEDKNLVVFSDEPHYVTTDNYGFFYVSGLEKGEHEIYYVGEADVTSKTKEEIKSLAYDEAQITTSDTTIKFDELKLDEFIVEPVKTGKVDINFDAAGGEVSEAKKNVELYTRAKDLPKPVRTGYTFSGWLYNGKIVSPNTIINDEKNLVATWNVNKYTVIFEGINYTSSSSSIGIEYGSTGTVTIAPSNGYYIKSVLCSKGYTTNASVGTGVISNQVVTITNNNSPSDSVCIITTESRNYAAVQTAATPVYHTHSSGCYSSCTASCSNPVVVSSYQNSSGYTRHNFDCTFSCGGHTSHGTVCEDDYPGQGAWGATRTNTWLSCNKGTNTVEYYTCSSGTLSGTSCYSCPNGGTLSGTTCVF